MTIGLFLVFIAYLYYESSVFRKNEIIIETEVKRSYRFLQISDFHSNRNVNFQKLIDDISQFNIDIIVLTGDIISRNDTDFNQSLKLIDALNLLNVPIYYVYGNHELENRNLDVFTMELNDRKVNILDNEVTPISDEMTLIGISPNSNRDMIEALLVNSTINVLLSHIPTRITKIKPPTATIALSGHTHGGQIRLPIIGQIITPEQPLFGGLDKGLTNLSENLTLYIDSGMGNSALPIRTFNKIQYSIIDIVPKKE